MQPLGYTRSGYISKTDVCRTLSMQELNNCYQEVHGQNFHPYIKVAMLISASDQRFLMEKWVEYAMCC